MTEVFSILLLIGIGTYAIRNVEFLLALLMLGQPVLSYAISLGEGLSVNRTHLGITQFALMIFVFLRVLTFVAQQRYIIRQTPAITILFIGILLNIVLLAAGLLSSPQPDYGMEKFLYHLVFEIGGFLLALVTIRTVEQARRFLWYCVLFGTITATLTVAFLWQSYDTLAILLRLPQEETVFYGFRLSSSLSLAYRQAVVGLIALSLIFLRRNREPVSNVFLLLLCLMSFYLVILTASRGPAIFVLCAVIISVFSVTGRLISKFSILLVTFGIAYLLLQLVPFEVQARFEETSLEERILVWQFGWQLGVDNFLTGVGLGGFGYYEIGPGNRTFPHNLIIEYFAETGILGLLLISSLLVAGLMRVRRLFRSWPKQTSERGVIAALISIFLIGFGQSMIGGTVGNIDFLWISFGLLFSPAFMEAPPAPESVIVSHAQRTNLPVR